MPGKFILEEVMPAETVHLVAGPSGAGKTKWVFQMLRDVREGKPVLGYRSHPTPFAYVTCDRSREEVLRTIEPIGFSEGDFPIVCLDEHPEWWKLDDPKINPAKPVLEYVMRNHGEAELVVIDGMNTLTPGGRINDYGVVATFLLWLRHWCRKNARTIIGIAHSTKMRENERIIRPRDRVIGSVAWAGNSHCIVLIEHAEGEESGVRHVWLLARTVADAKFVYEFTSDGILVLTDTDGGKSAKVLRAIEQIMPGETFTVDFLEQKTGVSRETIYRAIREADVERVSRGTYRKMHPL